MPDSNLLTDQFYAFGIKSNLLTDQFQTLDSMLIENVDIDDIISRNQLNVEINCINAGAVEGIVDYGGVVQDAAGVTWPAVESGPSTITVANLDAGSLPLGSHLMTVKKPI